MDIGQSIRKARKAKGLTLEALANQVDTDTGNLSRLERGLQGASQELLKKIMAILDLELVSAYDPTMGSGGILSSNEGHSLLANVAKTQMKSAKTAAPKLYPVIAKEHARSWAESSDFLKSDEFDMYLESTEDAGERGFWMVVRGDYMACTGNPSFPDGSQVLVKPGAKVVSGKYYIVELDSGEQTFKQYVEDSGHKYLRPLNPSYRTIEINGNCHFIGRVVDAKMTGL